eukprot:Lithocolla_globosa_v1_NODE_4491_length_1421_cov_41.694952.p1 type:complete len:213 gc:universal NODE_4491_length_1421_cov_41.694952:951-313(-)
MFADDTTLLAFNTDICALRENTLMDLQNIATWCKVNLLTLNASKTAYLLLSSATKQLPETIPSDNLPTYPAQETKPTSTTKVKKEGLNTIITTTRIEVTNISQAIKHEKISQKITTITPTFTNTTEITPYVVKTDSIPLNLTIDGVHIFMEDKAKFLGVMLHENVKWQQHVQMTIRKISKYIGIFCKLRYYCPQKILSNFITLYLSSSNLLS